MLDGYSEIGAHVWDDLFKTFVQIDDSRKSEIYFIKGLLIDVIHFGIHGFP